MKKTAKPMIVLTRYDGDIQLRATTIRELLSNPDYFREARRTDIARVFRSKIFVEIEGRYDGGQWNGYGWKCIYSRGRLTIGCQEFNLRETKTIRTWALAQKGKA